MIQFKIFSQDDNTSQASLFVILPDGSNHTLQADNANFKELSKRLLNQDEVEITEQEVRDLLNPGVSAGTRLQTLSERVTFDGSNIYFDGDILEDAIGQHIIRILKDQDTDQAVSYTALIAFLEKLASNPLESARTSLYEFIRRYNITITQEGDFIVYKGVREDGTSIHAGYGIVNGKVYDGHLPNPAGAVVEFPRSKVDANQAHGCSTGLHAGSYAYASGFAQGRLLTVKVNPRDVVSVPEHCTFQKIRVSRYVVIDTVEHEVKAATWTGATYANADVTITDIEDVIERYGEAEVEFTDADGDDIEFTIEDVEYAGEDVVFHGYTYEGKTRSYSFEEISNLAFAQDYDLDEDEVDEDENDDEGDADFGDDTSLPFDFDVVPAAQRPTSVDDLIAKIEAADGEPVSATILYTKEGADAPEQVDVDFTTTGISSRNNRLFFGTTDNGSRSYRADRIQRIW